MEYRIAHKADINLVMQSRLEMLKKLGFVEAEECMVLNLDSL